MRADRGNWIQTFTGRRFHYDDPHPDDIHIGDIAHALSNLCRYAGHSRKFYSVAEHSVLVARQFTDPDMRLAGLLHDATEAYCVDLPRPLKRMLPVYEGIESALWMVIAAKYGLPAELPDEVHDIDTRMLITERPFLFREVLPWPAFADVKPIEGVEITFMEPLQAKAEFLRMFYDLRQP
jgi:hypothetical protein